MMKTGSIALAMLALADLAAADETLTISGRRVVIAEDGMGTAALVVEWCGDA